MIFDAAQDAFEFFSEAEWNEEQTRLAQRVRSSLKRAFVCATPMLLCFVIALHLGHRVRTANMEFLRQVLLGAWLGLLLGTTYFGLLTWGAWRILRDVEKARIRSASCLEK